jgi:ribosome modulation factor
MKGKDFKKIGGFVLAALMLSGIAFVSADTVQAQGQRRVVVVRPYPSRFYRRFDVFGYDRWGYDRWGFDRFGRDRWGNERFGYDPWSPYGSRYRQYVFDNSEKAVSQGYKDGFKTGKADGKKSKSYNPQRSHFYKEAGFGNFSEVYRSAFSKGYQAGYRAGSYEREDHAG